MLSKKQSNKQPLMVIKKTDARIVLFQQPELPNFLKPEKTKDGLMPPLNQFNTAYMKAKDNDPL